MEISCEACCASERTEALQVYLPIPIGRKGGRERERESDSERKHVCARAPPTVAGGSAAKHAKLRGI